MRRACRCGNTYVPTSARAHRCPECEVRYQAARNARPERAIYDRAWGAESRGLRREQGKCHTCGATSDLTVDHPTRWVLCRSCHATLENDRRREAAQGRGAVGRREALPRYA
jgi:hypothetical protein